MKRWKIYVGVVVVMVVLASSLFAGSKMTLNKVSADEIDDKVSSGIEIGEVNDVVYVDTEAVDVNNEVATEEASQAEETITIEENLNDFASGDTVSETTYSEDTLEDNSEEDTVEVVNESEVEVLVNADPIAKIDEAYKDVLEEEIYISKLVSLKSGVEYNTSNWKECLNYLRNNYGLLKRDSVVDMDKVDSYVFAYNIIEAEENMPLEGVNNNAHVTRSNYNPKKVTEYTNKYWDNYNPNYPDFSGKGGDCANFVSQAVHAGGKAMKGTVAGNFANWFCRSKSDLNKISSTWRGADAFGHYWKANAKGFKTFDGSHFASKAAHQPIYNYTNVGDAISVLNSNGRPYHTLVVSYKNRVYEDYPNGSKMIHIAAHTNNHKWKSLYNKYKGYDVSIRVYDMY